MLYQTILEEFHSLQNPTSATILAGFFKTGEGQYGEGDKFLGIKVPVIRALVKKYYSNLSFPEIEKLLQNKYHEVRLFSLLVLVELYKIYPAKSYKTYMKYIKQINNWDLVDLTAGKIVGPYIYQKDEQILDKLAVSVNLWCRRIAIISTFYHLYQGEDYRTYQIAKILINDSEDLIHKAVGWLLREAGKRVSRENLTCFLLENIHIMPRTMLRYAIEHYPPSIRMKFLKKD